MLKRFIDVVIDIAASSVTGFTILKLTQYCNKARRRITLSTHML